MDQKTIDEGKTAAITCYILGIGVFIAMSMNADDKNKFASFHIRQGLGITITFISLGLIISNFDSLMISAPMWVLYRYYGPTAFLVLSMDRLNQCLY
jgi:hypothetical protein